MRSDHEHQEPADAPTYRELRLLSEVAENPEVTQRELSRRVGIALGLTNVLLRQLMQKGYIRATQAGWKRWLYNLTPDGFSHKIRLTVAYIHRFLNHYQQVREALRQQLIPLALHEESRIAIYGTGEFAELVYLGLKEYSIEEIDVYGAADGHNGRFLGIPIRNVGTLEPGEYDRIVIASLGDSDRISEMLQQQCVGQQKVVTFFRSI